jgi:archaellum component FlaC
MAPSEIAELKDFLSGELRKIHTRFDGVDTRFDGMDTRFDGMDTRFDGMDTRLDRMDVRFDGIDARLDRMDVRLEAVEGGLVELREKVDEVQLEQHAFQAHVADQFGTVHARLDSVSARLSRVEVLGEEMKSDFRAFGEALQVTNRRIDEFRLDVERELREVRAEMRGESPPWGSV